VGTAALQLLRLAGAKAYGAASAPKHDTLRSLSATPADYRVGSIDRLTRALEPRGVDHVFDAIGGPNIALLAEKKIDPLVNRTFPLLAARQAIEFLATTSTPSMTCRNQTCLKII
jgi:hypothetical protein